MQGIVAQTSRSARGKTRRGMKKRESPTTGAVAAGLVRAVLLPAADSSLGRLSVPKRCQLFLFRLLLVALGIEPDQLAQLL